MYPNIEDGNKTTTNVVVVSNPTTKRQQHSLSSSRSVYPVIQTKSSSTITTNNKTSLPELFNMIDENSIFSLPQKRLKTTNDDTCSMNSYETSSSVSTCSSETEISNDFVPDVNTLSHDVSPDSPDSGVSGSVNSTDDKCCDEDNEEDYMQLLFNKSKDLHYVVNKPVQKLEPVSNSVPLQNNEKTVVSEKIDSEDNVEISKSNQTITNSEQSDETSKQKSPPSTDSKEEEEFDQEILRQIISFIPAFSKGFQAMYNFMKIGPETEPEIHEQNEEENKITESSVSDVLNFQFDCLAENSSTSSGSRSNSAELFDWSIKKQGAPNMKSMIKEMQMNAKNLKNNDSIKIPQTFICQWHDCDWPGSYEDLADHLREIHVELQPFLDANGKVIKWNKKSKTQEVNGSLNDDSDDSDDSDDDEENEDDNDFMSEDENPSPTKYPTRGSKRKLKSLPSSLTENKKRPTRGTKSNSTVEDTNKFVCLWRNCKVYGKPSLSRNWIERHVLEQHSGPKPFKCIVDNCGQRFRTQNQMEKHVNTHFKQPNGNQSLSDLQLLLMEKNKPSTSSSSSNTQQTIGLLPKKPEKCCNCHCHSNCDNNKLNDDATASLKQIKINRGPNIESGINLQPSCSSSIPDASLSLSSSSSAKCLSKFKKNELPTANCISGCCLSNKLDSKLNKNLKNNKKKFNNNNNNQHFKAKKVEHDYFDDEFALRVEYEFKAREAKRLNLKKYEPFQKCIEKPNGTLVKLDTIEKEKSAMDVIEKLKKSQNSSSSSSSSPPFEIVNLFQKELFNPHNPIKNKIYPNELICCKTNSNNKLYFTCKWQQPEGEFLKDLRDWKIYESRALKGYFKKESFSYSKFYNNNNKNKSFKNSCIDLGISKIPKRSQGETDNRVYSKIAFVQNQSKSYQNNADSDSDSDADDESDSSDDNSDSSNYEEDNKQKRKKTTKHNCFKDNEGRKYYRLYDEKGYSYFQDENGIKFYEKIDKNNKKIYYEDVTEFNEENNIHNGEIDGNDTNNNNNKTNQKNNSDIDQDENNKRLTRNSKKHITDSTIENVPKVSIIVKRKIQHPTFNNEREISSSSSIKKRLRKHY